MPTTPSPALSKAARVYPTLGYRGTVAEEDTDATTIASFSLLKHEDMSETPMNFDALPASGYVRQAQIIPAVVPVSHATLWRWVRQGKFPAPVKLGPQVTAWRVGDLRNWMADQSGNEGA